jgi:hypothetical protein
VHFENNLDKVDSPGRKFAQLESTTVQGLSFPFFPTEVQGYNTYKASKVWTLAPKSALEECKAAMGFKSDRHWCSSGISTVLWAMKRCRSVRVYGAVHDSCYPYHYTDPMPSTCKRRTVNSFKDRKTSPHDFDKEHRLLEKLHNNGGVTMVGLESSFI